MSETPNSVTVWRLRAGADRRFRAGHPWVYSNELSESPKGIEPGASIELRDAAGKFLARGYGNPHSLIAFRELSRVPSDETPWSTEAITKRLQKAAAARATLGLSQFSYRLCFAEADHLPGLIIDRFHLEGSRQVYVVQAHTAGADRMLASLHEALKKLPGPAWNQTALVIKNDVGVRKLEGLQEEEPRVAHLGADLKEVNLRDVGILVPSAAGKAIVFRVDLLQGQKTGFFLDQVTNTHLAIKHLRAQSKDNIKVLDLCSYVGQWSTQIANAFGKGVDVTVVDSSKAALDFARRNVEAQGARCETLKGDVLEDLKDLPAASYDLVISDPPALIKSRKDSPQGAHAYLQLNTQALRLVKKGGAIVSCSCSALLDEEAFLGALAKAARRNEATVRWIARGGQSPDHPVLAEFPEGRYLKAWIGLVEG